MKTIEGVLVSEEEFYKKNTKLIWSIVNKFQPSINALGIDRDDLFNEGSIAFIKAYRRFDDSLGYKFSTYAVPVISGTILRFISDKTKAIRYSRNIIELANRIYKGNYQDLTVNEISTKLGETTTQVYLALESRNVTKSINEPIVQEDNEKATIEDLIGLPDDYTKIYIEEFIGSLNPREQLIMSYQLEDKRQKEIAEELGVTQGAICNAIRRISQKYKKYEAEAEVESLSLAVV